VYNNLKNTYTGEIEKKLQIFIRRYYLKELFKGSVINLALAIYLIFIFALAEYFLRFSSTYRLFILLSFSGILVFSIGRFLIWPLFKFLGILNTISHEKASAIIGNYFPEVQDQLLNLLQLQNEKTQNELVIASITQKAKKITPFEFKDALSFKDVFKFARWTAIPISLVIIFSGWNVEILSNSAKRIVQYNKEFKPENPFKFKLQNDQLSVIRNQNFTLKVEFTGKNVPNDIYIQSDEALYRLNKVSISKYEYEFRNVQNDVDFKIKTGNFFSETLKLSLVEKPVISSFSIDLNYPLYTRKKDESVENNGDLLVPEGTKINWKLNSKHADRLIFSVNDTTHKLLGNEEVQFHMRAKKPFKYQINAHQQSVIKGDPLNYYVNVLKDAHPKIKVHQFHDSINPLILFHSGVITDDYGFKKLHFHFENKDTAGNIQINIPTKSYQYKFNHGVNVKELGFNKGDEFSYYFEVFDNDGINGSKSSRSFQKVFKIPTEDEVNDLLTKNTEAIKDQLNKNLNKAQYLQEEFKEIKKMILDKKQMSWEEKARVDDFLQNQKSFEKQLEKLQFENEKNNFQKDQLSPQEQKIAQKQEMINKLFDELLDEETKKLYEELEKLMDQFNQENTEEMLEELNLSNEEIEKELDRTLEFFKQMEFDEKLDEAIKKLEDLAEKQEDLAEKTKENNELSKEELNEKQEEINKEFEKLEKELEELDKKNEELENKRSREDTKEQQEEIKKEQEKSSDELEKNNRKKSARSKKSAADKMQELAKKLESMQQEMQEEQQMEDINSLRQILENLISLSVEQEDLMQNIKQTNKFDPQFPVLATKQGDLKESAKIIEDSLLSLSKRQIALEPIINKEILDIRFNMDKSIDFLRERKTLNAAAKQQYVMTSANNLALILDESLQQMQKEMMKSKKPGSGSCSKPGGGSPKPMPSIKKMQQKLAEQLKQMKKELENGNEPGKKGQKGKSGLAKSLVQMSAQQNAIKQQLKQLDEQQKKQGNSGLGEMEDLKQKMEETERDILNKNITRETIMRQEEIMSKLLKAENAMRERELDDKRKSNQAKNTFNRNPADFIPYKNFESSDKEELRSIPTSFNLYYKRKISEYFNTFEE
jgi:hypothetical protein